MSNFLILNLPVLAFWSVLVFLMANELSEAETVLRRLNDKT